ncbi:MAG: hypothetical protein D6802_09530 [Ardenticatenia bacterium]|nr:MAG: hypothetical protein D6802_09530 [Ardenticatenia bacterium]
MPFTVRETRTYPDEVQVVYDAAVEAVAGLEGKVLKSDPDSAHLEAKFPKTIHGKVLGDRTQLVLQLRPTPDGQTVVQVEIFPLDAIGRKLLFGARKGVPETVMKWFFAHLEHRLPSSKG